jgi:hypothetical protein
MTGAADPAITVTGELRADDHDVRSYTDACARDRHVSAVDDLRSVRSACA